jgi:hypothetical protein
MCLFSPAALALTLLCALTQLAGAQPTVGAINVAGIMLCTNTDLTCTITSSGAPVTITNVSLSFTTTLVNGGSATSVTTNGNKFTTGLGTATATLTFPLVENVIYTEMSITALDSTGASGETNCVASELITNAPEAFDTLQPSLVIEAEDYNYTNGGYMNTPPDGGLALYTNQVGIAGVDFQWTASVGGENASSTYRPTDAVNGLGPQVETTGNNWQLMPQKFWDALANGDTTDVPMEIGYNSGGNWFDYTRDFGSASSNSAPAGLYNVYVFLSDDDAADPSIELELVTSDPTKTGQTTTAVLGQFNLTDANWNDYYYVPMTDQFGSLASITLSGHETLRCTVVGEANIDFFMLFPAVPVLTPVLVTNYPNGPYQITNQYTFEVGPANGAGIASNGITLVLNGSNVTSSLTLTGGTNGWTGTLSPLALDVVYNGVLSVTNLLGAGSSFTFSFDTFDINNFEIEAVDYDFSTNTGLALPAAQGGETNNGWISGLFIDNAIPTGDDNGGGGLPLLGTLEPNSYFNWPGDFVPTPANGTNGAMAQQGVDIMVATHNGEVYYRNDGTGMQPATDYVRPKFLAAQKALNDPNIGMVNVGWTSAGDWENYTRHYPAGTYNIYGRLAGNSAWANSTMSLVTSGVGTATQTLSLIGTFADPNANGWQSYHWIPCLDTNGNPATVTFTGDVATLQFGCGGGINDLFYMLVPYPPHAYVNPPLSPVIVSTTPSGSSGTLDQSTPFETNTTFSFTVSSPVGTAITSSGVDVTVNGQPIAASELTVSSSSTNYTVTFPLPSNTVETVVVNVTNSVGVSSSITKTFDTFDVNNYIVEANDYDYNGGLFIDDPVPTGNINTSGTGILATNSYFDTPGDIANSIALSNIDYYVQSDQTFAGGNNWYRADRQGSAPSGDYVRPKFLAAQTALKDANIGPFQTGYTSTGDWLNYTRHYPAGMYNIWGRIAGGAGPWKGTTISMVTSGVGTTNQTLEYLGSFADPNANGWESFHWIPLVNTNTSVTSLVTLTGDQTTLRVTCGGGVNQAYYMLVPAAAFPPSGITIRAALVGGQISISIQTATGSTYQLMHSSILTANAASWSAVGAAIVGDGSVHTVTESVPGAQGYYKVEVQ